MQALIGRIEMTIHRDVGRGMEAIFQATQGSLFAAASALPACAGAPARDANPADGATYVVYANGVFNWPGDYSYAAKVNYRDTSGKPATGTYDLAVSLTGAWGAWQPYGPNWDFDITPYKYLQFDLKPTADGQRWDCFALMVGDKNIVDPSGNPVSVDINKYGPAPQAGAAGDRCRRRQRR